MAKENRGAVLTLRITEAEQEELRRKADSNNQSVSEYVRSVVRRDAPSAGVTVTAGNQETTRGFRGQSVSGSGITGSNWLTAGPNVVTDGQTLTVWSPTD